MKTTEATPQGFPSVLGLTDPPQPSSFTFPMVEVIPVGTTGKVTFAKTTSADSDKYSSVSVAAMRHSFGKRKLFAGPINHEKSLTDLVSRVDGNIPESGDYEVLLVITADVATGIRDMEQQHPDDISHAYRITLEAAAAAVNALAGKPFDNQSEALKALVERIPSELLPNDATDPESWQSHLQKQLVGLLDLTKLRDPLVGSGGTVSARPGVNRIDHLPSKTVRFSKPASEADPAVCEVVVDKPLVANTTPTPELITFKRLARTTALASVPVVSPTPAAERPPAPDLDFDDRAVTIERIKNPLWMVPKPEGDPPIEKGVNCKLVSVPRYSARANQWICDVELSVEVEKKPQPFSATLFCSTLRKVAVEVAKPVAPAVAWKVGDELVIDARSNNDLYVEVEGDPSGKTKSWNGVRVKLESIVKGPEDKDLADQTFYRAKIIDVGPTGFADDLNQFIKPIAGCDLKKV